MRVIQPRFRSPKRAGLFLALVIALGIAAIAGWLHAALPPARPVLVQPPKPTPVPTRPPPCQADPAGLPAPRAANGQRLNYWHTCGTQIADQNGRAVRIAGIAWSGMELPEAAPDGLDRRSYRAILGEIKALGYNTVRIPFSSEAIQPGHYPSKIDPRVNPDLAGRTSLEVLDRIIAACHDLGLKVILDHHRIDPWSKPPLWFDGHYSTEQWIADWMSLAKRYRGDDTVIAMDLQNEPYGATWGTGDPNTDWRLAATRGGNAVLAANPYLLIFVEGIGTYRNDAPYWWGGELRGVRTAPIRLQTAGRLVYSPHEYGPSVYPQSWFSAPDFPSNLPAVWDTHWGFIAREGIAPVVVGETGSPDYSYDVGGTTQRIFLSYLQLHRIGFIEWAANPNSPDTGGLFESDWLTINWPRHALFAPYLRAEWTN